MKDIKIMTSYFYMIRFFEPYMIPLSTAASDPKWFHNYQGKYYQFKDKRGVWNGLRAEPFCASNAVGWDECGCPLCVEKDPDHCEFLVRYRAYLDSLSFDEMMERFMRLGKTVKSYEGFNENPILLLIVYEAPYNRCSERTEITKWFQQYDYPIEEFQK